MNPEDRIEFLGLTLPAPLMMPTGAEFPFPWVQLVDDVLYISGHLAQNTDGSIAGPFGEVGGEVSLEQAHASAKQVGLTILSNVKRELGDLGRVRQWTKAFGMVNAAPGFKYHPKVRNGFINLIIDIFCPVIRNYKWSYFYIIYLPFYSCVEIEAQLLIY